MRRDYSLLCCLPDDLLTRDLIARFRTKHNVPNLSAETHRLTLDALIELGMAPIDDRMREAARLDDAEYIDSNLSLCRLSPDELAIIAIDSRSQYALNRLLLRGADVARLREHARLRGVEYMFMYILDSKSFAFTLACGAVAGAMLMFFSGLGCLGS